MSKLHFEILYQPEEISKVFVLGSDLTIDISGIIQWVDLNLKEGDKLVTDFKALGIEYVFFSHSVPAYSWKKEDELQEAMNIIYAAKRYVLLSIYAMF